MSQAFYDALAPHYRDYARRRGPYIDAVDRLVAEWCPRPSASVLDVGSGDGSRGVRLARALGAPRLVLAEPSAPMAALCREFGQAEVWPCEAEALPGPEADGAFDAVLCLWNVLGHVDGHARRMEALRRMRALLAPGGVLVADVHNRYNVAAAGVAAVSGRAWRDWRAPAEENGDVSFTWQVNGQAVPARGHLFTPAGVRALCAEAGLRIVREAFVDYDTGRPRGPWTGQMVIAAMSR